MYSSSENPVSSDLAAPTKVSASLGFDRIAALPVAFSNEPREPKEPQLEELAPIESGTNVGVGVLGVLSENFIAASHDDKVAAQKRGGSVVSDFVVEKRDHTVISDALPEKVLSQNREAFNTPQDFCELLPRNLWQKDSRRYGPLKNLWIANPGSVAEG